MKSFRIYLPLLLLIVLFLLPLQAYADIEKPNIVLIVTDDQGWWDVGVHGNRDIETPVMDQLSRDGVNFTRFYAAPVCAPTRAGLMTGRYAVRTGVYNTRFGGDTMRTDEITLAQVLKKAGYRTGIFGKWHLGGHRQYMPDKRGFDEALTFTHGHTERYYYPELTFNGRPVASRGYITDVFTNSAIEFIKVNRERPFFLYVPYNVPHSPHVVDDEYVETYRGKGLPLRDARIYGMITQCDENMGRILKALDDLELRERTIVIFMSDNGGISRHFNAGLRGRKGSAYEGGVLVPFFVRWPGIFPAGAKVDAMATHLDLFPTICDLLDIPLPQDREIDGKSILSLMKNGGGPSPHEFLIHHWDRHHPRTDRGWSISEPRYKLVVNELYDLSKDRFERNNIAEQRPDIVERLRTRYLEWFEEVAAGRSFEPLPIEVGHPEDNPVEIQASWARLDGTHTTWSSPGSKLTGGPSPLGDPTKKTSINYTFSGYDWDAIDGWSKPGESVFWRLNIVREGRYEVEVAYGCNPVDAGGKVRLSIGAASLDAAVQPTPHRQVYEEHRLGILALPKGPARLVVEALDVPGSELMSLNRIWLRRLP